MEIVFNKIVELSRNFPDAVKIIPQEHDSKRVYKYFGKFPCPVDEGLLQFILKFNKVSIGDIFFYGIGDVKGSQDLYRFCLENWPMGNFLAGYFLGFASTSSGEIFGSLTNYKGSKSYPVGYLEYIDAEEFRFLGSGFTVFLTNLVNDFEEMLADENPKDDDKYVFQDSNFWTGKDELLKINFEKGIYKMPTKDNWKLEFHFL